VGSLILRLVRRSRVFQRQFSSNDFEQCCVSKSGSQTDLHQRPFALVELSDTFADDVDQNLLVRDVFKGFFNEVASHMKVWS
jgi:hypothetical protein